MLSSANRLTDGTTLPDIRRQFTRGDFTRIVIFIIILQNIVLLTAGSGPISLLLLTTMESVCYFLMYRYGKSDINAAIILTIGLTHLIIASFIKIILLQSLDDNLIMPDLTEIICLLYFIALTFSFFVARRLPIPRLHALPEASLRTLEWLTILSAVLMLVPLLSPSNADVGVNGPVNFWGVATRGFGVVAMVTSILRALKKSDGKRFIDLWSGSIFAIAFAMGMAGNSRQGVLTPLLVALIAPLYHGYRFSIRSIAGITALGVFVSFVVSPAMLIVRNDRDFLGFSERVEKTVETAGLLIIGDTATTDKAKTPLDFINYSVWGRYFGQPVPFADRIGLIQTTDALAAASYGGNYVTIDGSFRDMIVGLFPNFVLNWFDIDLQRSKASTDYVAGSLGLEDMSASALLAIPLDAEAYATGGMWSVVLKGFWVYLLVFYANRLAIGRQSIIGVLPISLLFLGYHVCSEADAGGIVYYTLRIIPQFVISFHAISWIARVLGSVPVGLVESDVEGDIVP